MHSCGLGSVLRTEGSILYSVFLVNSLFLCPKFRLSFCLSLFVLYPPHIKKFPGTVLLCTPHRTSFIWSYHESWDRRGMWHVWGTGEVPTGLWWGRPGKEITWKTGRDGRVILKWIFKKWDGDMNWIDLSQDRDRWWAVLNAAMNLLVP